MAPSILSPVMPPGIDGVRFIFPKKEVSFIPHGGVLSGHFSRYELLHCLFGAKEDSSQYFHPIYYRMPFPSSQDLFCHVQKFYFSRYLNFCDNCYCFLLFATQLWHYMPSNFFDILMSNTITSPALMTENNLTKKIVISCCTQRITC